MLYVSTRSKTDSYTSHRPLHEHTAPGGGVFVPFRLPQYSEDDIAVLAKRSFGENIAAILNLFFSCRLSGWDVDCCIGRYPVKLRMLGHRITVAEIWHNLESRYSYIEESLYHRIASVKDSTITPWFRTALRIAILFGTFGQMLADGIAEADIALPSDDFSFVISAWYAKKMGLPIGRIICACDESDNIWDLVHRGEYNTAVVARTCPCESDTAYPVYLEQLIFAVSGPDECVCFLEKYRSRSSYRLSNEAQNALLKSITAAVVWKSRIAAIMANFYRTNGYILDPDTARSFGAVQDVRAATGENKMTLIFSENDPRLLSDRVIPAQRAVEADTQKMINTEKE